MNETYNNDGEIVEERVGRWEYKACCVFSTHEQDDSLNVKPWTW